MVTISYPKTEQIEKVIVHKDPPKIQEKKQRELKYLQKASEAKNFKSWITSRIQLATLNKDIETEFILREVSKKYSEFVVKIGQILEIEIISGWKGEGSFDVYKNLSGKITVKYPIKDKETNEVEYVIKEVEAEDVNRILAYISTWQIGESHKCYDFAEVIGEYNWKEVWKKRTDVYFKKYYFPVKILEKLGLIKYSGRGTITRLK